MADLHLYRVIEVIQGPTGRGEKDIGSKWKSEKIVREELRALKVKTPGRSLAIQKKMV